jgi:hypothetical protein
VQSCAVWKRALPGGLAKAAVPRACERTGDVRVSGEDCPGRLVVEEVVWAEGRASGAWYGPGEKFLVMDKHGRHDASTACGRVKQAVRGGTAWARLDGSQAQQRSERDAQAKGACGRLGGCRGGVPVLSSQDA